MGVYVRLDIMPDKIGAEKWRKVYEESVELLKAYPFATLASDNFQGVERLFVDRAEEQFEDEEGKDARFWRVSGDLKQKALAFILILIDTKIEVHTIKRIY